MVNKGLTKAYRPKSNSPTRIENDFYPTPYIATLALLRNVKVPHCLWEPCAGKGHISKVLQDNGHDVFSSDLYQYETLPSVTVCPNIDFLDSYIPMNSRIEGIVTNPPFHKDMPQKILEKALKQYRFVALFCRLTFLESAKRYKMFSYTPPSNILVLSERVHVSEKYLDTNNGLGGMVAYAWFVWDRNGHWNGKNWIDPDYKTTKLSWVKPSEYVKDIKPWI